MQHDKLSSIQQHTLEQLLKTTGNQPDGEIIHHRCVRLCRITAIVQIPRPLQVHKQAFYPLSVTSPIVQIIRLTSSLPSGVHEISSSKGTQLSSICSAGHGNRERVLAHRPVFGGIPHGVVESLCLESFCGLQPFS